jgi:hypothetical protein
MGEAYSFFDAAGDRSTIVDGIGFAREMADVPSGLEVALGMAAELGPELGEVTAYALEAKLPYALKGSHPLLENRQVAEEILKITMAMYYDKELFPREELMRAEIVYDGGQGYISYD